MTAVDLLTRVNRLPVWAFKLPVAGRSVRATSLDRLVYLGLHAVGLIGAAERRFFETHVKPGMTVVDVGANLGVYTLLFSDLVGPSGRVVAFEPDPRLFRACAENCAGLRNVDLVNAAVGASCERLALVSGGLNSGDNRLLPNGADGPGAMLVDVVTLSSALGARANFVKIDVQGRELDVFKGFGASLGRVPLFFELWPYGLREVGVEPSALVEFLRDAGYWVTEPLGAQPGMPIDPHGLVVRLGKRGYTNLFAEPASPYTPTDYA